jgi:5-hydroxyisourate hydrolase
MIAISTHVLDTSIGRPAGGVAVALERQDGGRWTAVGQARTDADGRVAGLAAGDADLIPATYRLTFALQDYFAARGVESFHPEAVVVFRVGPRGGRYHLPLLIAPFGYTTYRGS